MVQLYVRHDVRTGGWRSQGAVRSAAPVTRSRTPEVERWPLQPRSPNHGTRLRALCPVGPRAQWRCRVGKALRLYESGSLHDDERCQMSG